MTEKNSSAKAVPFEISNTVLSLDSVTSFISSHTKATDSKTRLAIEPYKANFEKNTSDSILFCGLTVVDYWIFKDKNAYSFLLLVERDRDIQSSISKVFGKPIILGEVEFENSATSKLSTSTSVFWEIKSISILVTQFFNLKQIQKYDDCAIVIVGNIEYVDLLNFNSNK